MQDFDVENGSVKLKGINRSIPQLLVEKFIDVISLYRTGDEVHDDVYQDEEYLSLKRFFMWCYLNPRAEVADELYRFLVENSFRITKQGSFVALRNVVTLHGSNELVRFVSETYTNIKAVWKKSPNDYHVILRPDGTYTFMHYDKMFTNQEERCHSCGGAGDVWDDEDEVWTCCWDCDETRIMSVEEQVKAHTRQVAAGTPVRYGQGFPFCPNSNAFHVHDCRSRTFRLIVEGCVKIFRSGIWRWLCGRCGRRFTDYPRLPCRTNAL